MGCEIKYIKLKFLSNVDQGLFSAFWITIDDASVKQLHNGVKRAAGGEAGASYY